MLVYNTTYHVEEGQEKYFLIWMKECYLPEVEKEGTLHAPRILRILSHREEGSTCYSVQFEVERSALLHRVPLLGRVVHHLDAHSNISHCNNSAFNIYSVHCENLPSKQIPAGFLCAAGSAVQYQAFRGFTWEAPKNDAR